MAKKKKRHQKKAKIKPARIKRLVSMTKCLFSSCIDEDLNLSSIFTIRLLFIIYMHEKDLLKESEIFLDRLKERPENLDKLNNILENLFIAVKKDSGLDELFNLKKYPLPLFKASVLQVLPDYLSENYYLKTMPPSAFASVLDGYLSPPGRKNLGVYFTDSKNIHKVIDPLFLNKLKEELKRAADKPENLRQESLIKFLEHLSKIGILDPACGAGSFLIESYSCLRELENNALLKLNKDSLKDSKIPRISFSQFFGIEINPLAIFVLESLFKLTFNLENKKTKTLTGFNSICEGKAKLVLANALTSQWKRLLPSELIDYIIGNPPYIGGKLIKPVQREEMNQVFGPFWKSTGVLDYACAWVKKTYDFIGGSKREAAFVLTSSVCQGISVDVLWNKLFSEGLEITFAHTPFQWNNVGTYPAKVFCVVVGFRSGHSKEYKKLYSGDSVQKVENINGYLNSSFNLSIKNRSIPLCESPAAKVGNKPIDGGHYLFKKHEMEEFIKEEPGAEKYFKKWYGSHEFVSGQPRYCLCPWEIDSETLKTLPKVRERIQKVKEYRLSSISPVTRQLASSPDHFHVENFPENEYLLMPRLCGNKRDYLLMGFMSPEDLASDSVLILSDASRYHFAILSSSLHMLWVKNVCGRYGQGYRYSKGIVYNNFPWPNPSESLKEELIESAQDILNIREKHQEISLNALYRKDTMPEDLKKAHEKNDLLVLKAYGLEEGLEDQVYFDKLIELYRKLK